VRQARSTASRIHRAGVDTTEHGHMQPSGAFQHSARESQIPVLTNGASKKGVTAAGLARAAEQRNIDYDIKVSNEVRCSFSNRMLHSRMLSDPTLAGVLESTMHAIKYHASRVPAAWIFPSTLDFCHVCDQISCLPGVYPLTVDTCMIMLQH
jgi:hypothetical protein